MNSLLRLRTSTIYSSQALLDPWSGNDGALDADTNPSSGVVSAPTFADAPAQAAAADDFPPPSPSPLVADAPAAPPANSAENAAVKTFDIAKAEEEASKWETHFK